MVEKSYLYCWGASGSADLRSEFKDALEKIKEIVGDMLYEGDKKFEWEEVKLEKQHARTKGTRKRGEETPGHMATMVYLRSMDAELERVRLALDQVWESLGETRDFRKCSKHADHAQQRLHKLIKRLQSDNDKPRPTAKD